MLNFKKFFESVSFMADVNKTILKIPKKHQELVKNYKFRCEGGNTLKGDPENVGEVDEEKKQIKVAAPLRYGREFVILHEIAHCVWKYFVSKEKRKKWMQIVKNTKNKPKLNAEELFCHTYGCLYSDHPPTTYSINKWLNFVKKI